VQGVHVDDPAEVVGVGRAEPVELPALVNLETLDGRAARRLDLDLHVVFREVAVGGDVLVGDDVAAALILEHGPLDVDAERVFVVADGGDLAAAAVFVEADDAEAGEPDERGGGTFINWHNVLLASG
jgi:hypothetical protein